MSTRRKAIPSDVRHQVLHEAGYKCGNPACHSIITLDIHHLEHVSAGGGDTGENLLPLCPNCHALHHRGVIATESIRAWKMLLLSLNEGYDRKTLELLIALGQAPGDCIFVSGDGLLSCSPLVAGALIDVSTWGQQAFDGQFGYQVPHYRVALNQRGRAMLEAWRKGDQEAVVALTSVA
jgi:hypothetical protein